ncbi:carboxypeptidase M32 [Virgibacillus halophilus]|uniref:Metal-dependent carboxypeptidase n=1 Tax=Tigheibacillus halophilus TaxID=361280 RepID=A0ABU5CC59_9BACI|nr:carboxypeptidase M32 [Virgibacillus halophilus]
MNQIKDMEKDFLQLLKEQSFYQEAINLSQWDARTKLPAKGAGKRAEVAGFLSEKLHLLQTSDRMKYFIDMLKEKTNDAVILKSIGVCEDTYERNKKIPHEEMKEYVTLQSKSEAIWQEAREKSDFSLFQPYLEKLVHFNKKFAAYWGYEEHIYDALLHDFEPGVTVKVLDSVFPKLKDALTSLLEKMEQSHSDTNPLIHHFPKENQRAFSLEILKKMGYDFGAGRLDETIHPFAIGINKNDVRITTRYDENDFRMAVFGTIHEGGHALYEQNLSDILSHTPLSEGTSMGIHESQSLFWEIFVGRSKAFWKANYNLFQSHAPAYFREIPLDNFYGALNEVKPSFIRIEADELTYSLHIMLRYELEKALLNGEIHVKDLPELWNEKMRDYLGVVPASDKDGVLQDIHWAGGDFGYFPSYSLGYMYAAQFENTMKKQFDLNEVILSGDYRPITNWLKENIHQYGKMKKPLEILQDVTGEGLNPDYLIRHFQKKF